MEWLFFAFLSVIFASTREILQKRALQEEHTLEYLVVRGIFITLIALALIPFTELSVSWQAHVWMISVALIAAIAVIYRNKALKHTDISIIQPLMNTQPLFVAIIAFFLLGEKLTLVEQLGILLIVIGTYTLEIDHEHHGVLGPLKKLGESKYSLMVLFAIFLFSITTIMDKHILTTYTNPITYFFYVWVFMSLFIIAWHGINYKFKNIGKVFRKHGARIFWPSLFSVLMILSLYQAMTLAYVGLVIAVYRLQSIITTIEGGIFFHEDHLAKKSAACLVMVIGAILVII